MRFSRISKALAAAAISLSATSLTAPAFAATTPMPQHVKLVKHYYKAPDNVKYHHKVNPPIPPSCLEGLIPTPTDFGGEALAGIPWVPVWAKATHRFLGWLWYPVLFLSHDCAGTVISGDLPNGEHYTGNGTSPDVRYSPKPTPTPTASNYCGDPRGCAG
jgi:hypothetical protein